MRIAVLGDIHSNHVALEACMRLIEDNDIDGIAFLGDYVSDCPYPSKTMRILRNIPDWYKTWFIRGNREDYLLAHRYSDDGWHYCSQSGSLLYTFEELTSSDLRFFEDMPIGMEVLETGLPPFSICHASMQDNRLLFDHQSPLIDEIMEQQATELMICGHYHVPYIYKTKHKRIINAGSAGMNSTGRPGEASMLIISSEGEKWQAEHMSVPYDVDRVIKEFKTSGMLEKANVWSRASIALLKTGIDYNYKCVMLVQKLIKESGAHFDDEATWQKAAEMLGI